MKIWSLVLILGLCLCSCRKKEASDAGTHADKASLSPVGVKLSPEQLSSTLRVRVTFGGLPPRSYAAALLHREDVASKPITYGKNRLVLALLKGWTEKQLRESTARITVIRNTVNPRGESISSSRVAKLLRFSEQSGIALLSYTDDFEYALELGFHLDRSGVADAPLSVIRTSSSSNRVAERSNTFPPFSVDAGICRPGAPKQRRVEFPSLPPDVTADTVHLAIRPPDKLVGFVETDQSGVGAITAVENVETNVPGVVVNTLGIAFGASEGGTIKFGISTETASGGPAPRKIEIRRLKSPDATLLGTSLAATKEEGYAPISGQAEMLEHNRDKPGQWLGSLSAPSKEGDEYVYLLQLTWQISPEQGAPAASGKPFVVKLQKRAGTIYPKVEGIANLNPVQIASKVPETRFDLEARVVDIQEIAGGREVLMRLEGPPYWKRFSFTRNEWMPLPSANLSNVYITGNLSALFILDKGAAEVRKYSLTNLQPLASAKLPTDKEYVAVLGGCNSERAPIHVASTSAVMSLSAATLLRQDVPRPSGAIHRQELGRGFSAETRFQVTGDGLTLSPGSLTYTDDAAGLGRDLSGSGGSGMMGYGVSAAFRVSQEGNQSSWLSTFATATGEILRTQLPQTSSRGVSRVWALRNSPVILRLSQGSDREVPARPTRVELFSYFDTTPFAEITAAEFDAVIGEGNVEFDHWFSFDPYSLRLGSVSAERKAWTVHQVVAQENRQQPVLLNWPDTSLSRGEEFNFKPLIFGGTMFGAEVTGIKETASPTVSKESVSFRVAPTELASLFLMTLKVPGQNGGELSYNVPLHVFGPQVPIVVPINAEGKNINQYGAGFKSLVDRKRPAIALAVSRNLSADPVQQVLGPVGGHLALVTSAQRVDLLSLQTRKIVSSFVSSTKAGYYAGAEALFEYDSTSRTLTRISVPDGRRERSMTLPNGLRLHALAVGSNRSSPITLILEQIQAQETDRFGNLTVTTTQFDRNVVVLDSRTLQAGGWAQPKLWIQPSSSSQVSNPFNYGGLKNFPDHLPSSYSGQFVTLPTVFLALGQSVSMAAPFPGARNDLSRFLTERAKSDCSISGINVFDSAGRVSVGGVSNELPANVGQVFDVTPCGRYRLLRAKAIDGDGDVIEVRTVEGNRPLFRVGRLSLLQDKFRVYDNKLQGRVEMLSEAGPLMVLAGGGKAMDLIDLDIPRLARETAPTEFHITSQPAPCVMEGATLEYQIQSNNPGAIATCRLRNQLAGATISPTGLLRYTAPRPVAEPTRVEFSLEIVGKEGQTILHEFPLFVLPYPKTNVVPKQENTRRPGI